MRQVFVSDAVGPERLVGATPQPGTAVREHWKQLAARYRASLAAAGCVVEPVLRPEIYQTAIARRVLGVATGGWHLCVKPVGDIRPFHGLPNVFVFDEPDTGQSIAPDALGVLQSADAVLCGSEAAADRLRAAGLQRVLVLAPPPAAPLSAFIEGLARLEHLLARRP